jgi:hypothetical protein
MLDFRGSGLRPWDLGSLKAHQISAVSTTTLLQRHLEKFKRRRRGPLAWLMPGRRQYLDGLISGIEKALERRHAEGRR